MLANANLISCNFPTFQSPKPSLQTQTLKPKIPLSKPSSKVSTFTKLQADHKASAFTLHRGPLQVCHSALNEPEEAAENESEALEIENGGDEKNWTTSVLLFVLWGALMFYVFTLSPNQTPRVEEFLYENESEALEIENGGDEKNWTTSVLLFVLWGALMFYVFTLSPNQTPSRDMYFVKKLLNLKGDDGFRMNQMLVAVWYIMGLWPLVYSMLLLPTGRSSKSSIPVWPFLILSFFGGAYALLPYFVLWKPPPPNVDEIELGRWPLNFLESKLTAGFTLAAGLGIVIYAGLASGADWKEYYQYFNESKFIHVMSLDFTLLSAFAPFWVYNDMTSRKWFDSGSWLLPLSLVPILGPALYLILRPSLSTEPKSLSPAEPE